MNFQHVLIADGDALFRRSLSSQLRLAGYDVTQAENGRRTLEVLASFAPGTHPVDMLVVDLDLAEARTLDLLRQLRSRQADLPILCISARPLTPDQARAFGKLGAAEFLEKPFPAKLIVDKLAEMYPRDTAVPVDSGETTEASMSV